MSTQRRVARWQRRTSAERAGESEILFSSPFAQLFRVGATGRTAPPQYAAWLATNSLPMDIRFVSLAGRDVGRGSPPQKAADHAGNFQTPSNGSFLSLTPHPDGLLRIHQT